VSVILFLGHVVTLGNAIKLIRTAKGMKQLTLAERLDVSPNYISLVEKDRREPSIPFLRKLAKELGVPIGLFFLWQDTDDTGVKAESMAELRDLLTRIQAMYLQGIDSRDEDAA
jgi:transcriptional regulator with XRE-family HTH domain